MVLKKAVRKVGEKAFGAYSKIRFLPSVELFDSSKEAKELPPDLRKLTRNLFCKSFDVRQHTLYRLEEILSSEEKHQKSVFPFLIHAAKNDSHHCIREKSIDVLGELKCRQAVPHFIELLEKGRLYSCEALGKIGDPVAGPALLKAFNKYKTGELDRPNTRIAESIAEVGFTEAIPDLVQSIRHSPLTEWEKRGIVYSVDSLRQKLFNKKSDPGPGDAHYVFELVDYYQHPEVFVQLYHDLQNPALKKRGKDFWDIYAKELIANKAKLKRAS